MIIIPSTTSSHLLPAIIFHLHHFSFLLCHFPVLINPFPSPSFFPSFSMLFLLFTNLFLNYVNEHISIVPYYVLYWQFDMVDPIIWGSFLVIRPQALGLTSPYFLCACIFILFVLCIVSNGVLCSAKLWSPGEYGGFEVLPLLHDGVPLLGTCCPFRFLGAIPSCTTSRCPDLVHNARASTLCMHPTSRMPDITAQPAGHAPL